jgi:cytoskeletal protein CcmA (bactofilin family)
MMFKKYAKSILDKEITPGLDLTSHASTYTTTQYQAPLEELGMGLKSQNILHDSSFEEPETTIGENVTIKGTLSFQRLLRVDGNFEGELQSQGKLIIGPQGSVKAHINLDEAFISGKVEGNICVKNRLVLRGRAEISGNITAGSLSVDEGVVIEGHVKVGKPETPATYLSDSSSSFTPDF